MTGAWRALRLVALLETASFAVLLVGSVLRRTTELDPVPVLGALHGGLFVALVVLVLANWRRLGWAPWFALVMLTVGSPGAHFAVAATVREADWSARVASRPACRAASGS